MPVIGSRAEVAVDLLRLQVGQARHKFQIPPDFVVNF
jgi:hypothetical protein